MKESSHLSVRGHPITRHCTLNTRHAFLMVLNSVKHTVITKYVCSMRDQTLTSPALPATGRAVFCGFGSRLGELGRLGRSGQIGQMVKCRVFRVSRRVPTMHAHFWDICSIFVGHRICRCDENFTEKAPKAFCSTYYYLHLAAANFPAAIHNIPQC